MLEPDERPPIATEPISVVLPAHNAENCLDKTIGEWVACLESRRQDYEILLVDDGSTDRTGELADSLSQRHSRLRLLRHPARRGFGAALGTGLEVARHPLLCYTLCGGSYRASDLADLLKWIDKVDLVVGYRSHAGRPWLRRLGGVAYRLLLRLVFALRLKDPRCTYLLARRSIFRRIRLQSTGPFAHAEVLAKANSLGCLMTDAPVSYRPPSAGEEQMAHGSVRDTWSEAWGVISDPDFGPAFLPEDAPWCADWVRALSPFAVDRGRRGC